jgi:hypothetical protein
MTFLERTYAALHWGLGRLGEYLALWRRVMPKRVERRYRGRDIFDLATFNARERQARRYHWRFARRVFIYVFSWMLVYTYAYVCVRGGDGELFRAPYVQEHVLSEALFLSAQVLEGDPNV